MGWTTDEEGNDIKTYIILPMLLDLVHRYSFIAEFKPLKYLKIEQFQELLDLITHDHVACKKRLKEANIKVVQNWKPGSAALDYKIYVRRYEETFSLWKNLVKAEMSVLLGKYVARLDSSKFKKHLIDVEPKKKDEKVDGTLFVNFD